MAKRAFPNLYPDDFTALDELKKNQALVIKPSDKGNIVTNKILLCRIEMNKRYGLENAVG